jgi:hypothetical protein
MAKYTPEEQIFLCDGYVKKNTKYVKEGFAISILVFEFNHHQ